MSRKLNLQIAFVAALGLSLGAIVTWITESPAPSRGLASKSVLPSFQGKTLAVLQVSLQAPEGIPTSESDEVTLVGWIRLNKTSPEELRFRWELPEGVQVVEGTEEGGWNPAPKGETLETRITLRGFSQESLKLVSLHGLLSDKGTEYGNSAILTSRPQDSFEIVTGSAPEEESSSSEKVGAASRKPSSTPLEGRIIR